MSNSSNKKQLFGDKKSNLEQQILLPATKATQGQQPKSNSNKKVLPIIFVQTFDRQRLLTPGGSENHSKFDNLFFQ